MRLSSHLYLLVIVMVTVATGCTTFHARPIFPLQTASAFEARTLDNPGLKAFLEENLHRKIVPWPPASWDFERLTLAALYYHPDLDVARVKWEIARAGKITAGGRPNPNLGLISQYNTTETTVTGVSPWILGLNLDIPIETAGKRGYRIARAEQLSEAARLDIATVAWRVRTRLRENLLNLYAADQELPVLEKKEAIEEENVGLLEERLAVGEASQPDVTQAHIALDQTHLSLLELQKQAAEARVRLAESLGMSVAALDSLHLSFDVLERSLPGIPSQDIRRQALLNRTAIRSSLAEYAASQSALQLEIAKQYPDIHLGPGYTWDQGNNKWSLGFSIELPILNQNQGPIAEAEARRKEAAARFTALQAGVIGEIDRTLAGYRVALQQWKTAEALLSDRKDQLQTLETLFEIGETDRLALFSARLELISAELAGLNTRIKVQQSLGLLEDAVQRPLNETEPSLPIPEMNPRAKEERSSNDEK